MVTVLKIDHKIEVFPDQIGIHTVIRHVIRSFRPQSAHTHTIRHLSPKCDRPKTPDVVGCQLSVIRERQVYGSQLTVRLLWIQNQLPIGLTPNGLNTNLIAKGSLPDLRMGTWDWDWEITVILFDLNRNDTRVISPSVGTPPMRRKP